MSDQPEHRGPQRHPDQEQRGVGDVIQNAEHLATIYAVYKATHPSKPKEPPERK
jgi:hypothetical protein